MKDKVSVIVPIYNTEKYLKVCIDSILAQTFRDFELLLLNDGSKDGSLAICEEYAKQDSRVRVYSHPNRGLSKTRERGLHLSEGKYIVFIDSDDWIDGDYLMQLYNAAENHEADLVCCNGWDDGVERLEIMEDQVVTEPECHMEAFWRGMMYTSSQWGKMYRSEALNKATFGEIDYCEDAYVVTQVLHNIRKTVLLRYTGYNYVANPGSMTRAARGIKREVDALRFFAGIHALCEERYPKYLPECYERWGILMFNLICAASTSQQDDRRKAEELVREHIGFVCGKGIKNLRIMILRAYLIVPGAVSTMLAMNRKRKGYK